MTLIDFSSLKMHDLFVFHVFNLGTSVPAVLGAKLWTSNNANYKSYKPLKACLDSFLIYKQALSASQILALYNYYNPTVAAVHSNALPECDPAMSSISCPQ
jgi:hypothetical protein